EPVTNPTMRWVFQMLEGVHVVYIAVKGQILQQITGITDIKRKILEFFYTEVQEIYHLEKV
uniref:hypothetical protein n=1 Tax=Facilibium subflavum TaxID=2219058 RepID=UPI001AADA78F